MRVMISVGLAGLLCGGTFAEQAPMSRLRLQQYVADEAAFHVVSTLIVGPTEVMLVDAQMKVSDGRRVAEMIAATGKRLTSIVITHPDEDHTFGAQPILERFPATPVYMTRAAIEDFKRHEADFLKGVREMLKDDAPDRIVAFTPLPSTHLTVDGERVDIVPDLQGDVLERSNSFLHIPSLSTLIAGDIVFSGVHPFLANSTESTRMEWRKALAQIAALRPRVVVPGHKPSTEYPDSPAAVAFMTKYLDDFDAARRSAADATELEAAMRFRYPDLAVPRLLTFSARRAFRRAQFRN
jgi:glyoxylase-like metal-dependent hydrolase (beta-lactamase superfamily II)